MGCRVHTRQEQNKLLVLIAMVLPSRSSRTLPLVPGSEAILVQDSISTLCGRQAPFTKYLHAPRSHLKWAATYMRHTRQEQKKLLGLITMVFTAYSSRSLLVVLESEAIQVQDSTSTLPETSSSYSYAPRSYLKWSATDIRRTR